MQTNHKNIIDYWATIEDECNLSIDWAEAHERCWRCGYKTKLDRCHIVPDSLNGPDEPSNLVLLCLRCHREAPNHTNPKYMWVWLKSHKAEFYDTYWTSRGMEEFERMFGRKLFAGLTGDNETKTRIDLAMEQQIKNVMIHWGEGRLNPATIACVLAEVEASLI